MGGVRLREYAEINFKTQLGSKTVMSASLKLYTLILISAEEAVKQTAKMLIF